MKIKTIRNIRISSLYQFTVIVSHLIAWLGIGLFSLFQINRLTADSTTLTEFFLQTGLVAAGMLGLAFILQSILFRRWIGRTIDELNEQVITILSSDTNLGNQIPEPHGEEFQGLTRSINQMSLKLHKYAGEVESKVIERTRLLEEGSRLVQEVLDTTPNLLCLMNTEIDQYNYVNREFSGFFGVDNEEMLGFGPSFFRARVFPEDLQVLQHHEQRLMDCSDEDVIQNDFRMVDGNGEWRWVSMRSVIFQRNRDSKPKLVLHVGQDITDLKVTEEKLRYLSIHDQLTGLYNRLYFEEEMARLERGRIFPVSLIMADLDNLKIINDTHGHAVGDEVIRAASQILKASFRGGDVIARIGGDEFAALLPGASEDAAKHVIDRILERVQAHALVADEIMVSISLGVATIHKGELLSDGLKTADEHMYEVKQLKKIVRNPS